VLSRTNKFQNLGLNSPIVLLNVISAPMTEQKWPYTVQLILGGICGAARIIHGQEWNSVAIQNDGAHSRDRELDEVEVIARDVEDSDVG